MDRKDLETIKRLVNKGKDICNKAESSYDTKDILKSFLILESKINYYLSNYDALKSHNLSTLEEDEK